MEKKNTGSERTDKLGGGAVRKMTPFWLQEEARSSTRNFLGMSKHKYLMCLKVLTCKGFTCRNYRRRYTAMR
jgi:hypothetical protein